VEVTVSPLWKPEEKPGRNMIVVEDITERKQSEEELRRSQDIAERLAQEMAVIAEIGKVVGSTMEIEEVYERFAAEVRKLIPFDRLAVNLHDLDRDMVSIVYSSGGNIAGRYPGDSFPLKDSVSEVLVRTKAGIFSHPSSIEEMDKHFPNHSASIRAGMRSLLSVPLISRDEVIASLHFRSKKPNAYTERDLRLAERIGDQIAGAIANAQLYAGLRKTEKELRESEEEQRLLIETLPIAVFVEAHGKITYVNPAFLTLFKASSPNEVIGIRLIEFVSPELYDTIEKRRRIMTDEKCVLPPLEQNLRCMDGTFITVVSTSMPFIFQGQPAILTALYDITERKRSEIELGKTYKLLQIHSREIEDLQAKLKEQAIRDPLTGLFNRRYLEETMERELARASREGFPIGVVMIDIDHFKQVNDRHGHKAGDLILQAMGKLLLGAIRAGDIACRYGGEEFLLILPQASRAFTAERAEEWRTRFGALKTVYGENVLQATISLGVAAYPADGATAEELIHGADQAMFRAKALGRNRVVLS
jgi:diguanylate cyclase (GGDEF)-like protein/PAS domain S-box-containing protein